MRHLLLLAVAVVALATSANAAEPDPCGDAIEAATKITSDDDDVRRVTALKQENNELLGRMTTLMEIKMETGSTTADGRALGLATKIFRNDNEAVRLLQRRLLMMTIMLTVIEGTCGQEPQRREGAARRPPPVSRPATTVCCQDRYPITIVEMSQPDGARQSVRPHVHVYLPARH